MLYGRECTVTQVLAWMREHRGYTLCRDTMLRRMRDGLTDDALVAPSNSGWRRGMICPRPVTSEKHRAAKAAYRAKQRFRRSVKDRLQGWPRSPELAAFIAEIREQRLERLLERGA